MSSYVIVCVEGAAGGDHDSVAFTAVTEETKFVGGLTMGGLIWNGGVKDPGKYPTGPPERNNS